jgi:hypothetical protein
MIQSSKSCLRKWGAPHESVLGITIQEDFLKICQKSFSWFGGRENMLLAFRLLP